ncbi:hypothetical protein TWF281_006628 [Arthrobotrys megalospora]
MKGRKFEDIVRGVRRRMNLSELLFNRKGQESEPVPPAAGKRVRVSAFKEEFGSSDGEKPSLGNGHGEKETPQARDEEALLHQYNETVDATTEQSPSAITSEDSNIIAGLFQTNTVWLEQNLPGLLPSHPFPPYEPAESEQDIIMGKKTARQAHRKQMRTAAKTTQPPSSPTPTISEASKAPEVPKSAISKTEPGPKVRSAAQGLNTTALKTVASGSTFLEAAGFGSATFEPPSASAASTSIFQPAKDQLVVNRQLFDLVSDIGIFTRWKRDDFHINLGRNELLVFIHLYAPRWMPTVDDDLRQVRKVFFDHVYPKYYWICWVRDAIMWIIRYPAPEMISEEDIATLKIAADDVNFLEWMAPEFKARSQAHYARYNLQRIKASKENEQNTEIAKPESAQVAHPTIDVNVGNISAKKPKKKKNKKKKGKEKEIDDGGDQEGASVSMVSPEDLEEAEKASQDAAADAELFLKKQVPSRMPQVRKIGNFDDLMDVFISAMIDQCA